MMREIRAVILAAGRSTRMKSEKTKMVHDLQDKPMVKYVTEACRSTGIETIYIIIGYGANHVKQVLRSDYHYVLQQPQLGTAHALMQVHSILKNYQGDLLVLVGDSPFITPQTLNRLIAKHRASGAVATFLTAIYEEPPPYGRILRDKNGGVIKITEEKEASPRIRAIKEVNTSHYCFKADTVLPLLSEIGNDNVQQEYYLTDIIEILVNKGHPVETLRVENARIGFGINTPQDMKEAILMISERNTESQIEP